MARTEQAGISISACRIRHGEFGSAGGVRTGARRNSGKCSALGCFNVDEWDFLQTAAPGDADQT